MSEDEALLGAVGRQGVGGFYRKRDDANDAWDTGAQDGTGERGHLAFAIVSAQFEDGRGRMSKESASNIWNSRP